MQMRHWHWVSVVAAGTVGLTSAPALAAHGPTRPPRTLTSTLTFTDPAGDFAVPAQDVVRVMLRSTARGSLHLFSADIVLAAPDGPAPTQFEVGFQVGPTCYTLAGETANGQPTEYSAGGAKVSGTGFTAVRCSDSTPQLLTSAPATMSVRAATVHLEAPYAFGMRPGQRVNGAFVAVGTEPVGVGTQVGGTSVTPTAGDFAGTSGGLPLR
jgi:hypothetical protein